MIFLLQVFATAELPCIRSQGAPAARERPADGASRRPRPNRGAELSDVSPDEPCLCAAKLSRGAPPRIWAVWGVSGVDPLSPPRVVLASNRLHAADEVVDRAALHHLGGHVGDHEGRCHTFGRQAGHCVPARVCAT